jgi:hypothetical protein
MTILSELNIGQTGMCTLLQYHSFVVLSSAHLTLLLQCLMVQIFW